MRLVNRMFDKASKQCFLKWKAFLIRICPKKIGNDSVHQKHYTNCHLNKDGKCTLYVHYKYDTVIPKYNLSDNVSAYNECMRILGKKNMNKLKSHIKCFDRAIEKNNKTVASIVEEIKELKTIKSQTEIDFNNAEKHYQTFLKRPRATKTTKTAETTKKESKKKTKKIKPEPL